MLSIEKMLSEVDPKSSQETVDMLDEDAGLPKRTLVPSPKPKSMEHIVKQCLSSDMLLNLMPGVC